MKLDKNLPDKIYSFFKEGLNDLKTSVVNAPSELLKLPINNFLKDAAQMEKEFREEVERLNKSRNENEYYFLLNGRVLEASEVLKLPMEENY